MKIFVCYGIIVMVSNIVFNVIFVWFYGYVGLVVVILMFVFFNMVLFYCGLYL